MMMYFFGALVVGVATVVIIDTTSMNSSFTVEKFKDDLARQLYYRDIGYKKRAIKTLFEKWFKENEDGLLQVKSPKFVVRILNNKRMVSVFRAFGMFKKHYAAVALLAEFDANNYANQACRESTYVENYNNIFLDETFRDHYNTFFMNALNEKVRKEAMYDASKDREPDPVMLNDTLMSAHYKKVYFQEKAKNDMTKSLVSDNREELKALIESSEPEFSKIEAEDFSKMFKQRKM